jgi:hypothetical protein
VTASFSVVIQQYETDVAKEYVITGNDVLIKFSLPSFAADVVQVVSWVDSEGNKFSPASFTANGIWHFGVACYRIKVF